MACQRTGARINADLQEFKLSADHRHGHGQVVLHDLMPYLDDYVMNAHDPFVEDFSWSMDDSRHTESKSKELTEVDVPRLLLFADQHVIQAVPTTSASSAAEVAGRDPTRASHVGNAEVKRHRQGQRTDEMGSSDVLDVTVFNLGNLARQTMQHQAEPRMLLRLIVNQTSRIMMLVEGTSLAVNQWDRKLREANWTLCSSDDHHHWLGVRTAHRDTTVRKLVDSCGSEHQEIWYTVFEVKLGTTSTDKQVWKGGQSVYRLMAVHVNHAVARTACRSCRISLAELLILCAHFQVDFMGGDFDAFSYRYFRIGSQQVAVSLQDSSLAVRLRRSDEGINTQWRDVYENHPKYQFRSDLYMAYYDRHIEEYRLKQDEILKEVTDAAGESTKIPRLQHALQEYDENVDVIGLINFSWDHTVNKPLKIDDRYLRERRIPQSKSSIIKNKYAIRYLAGQERMCRLSFMAKRITPQLLNLRSRDQDMRRVLKVALQPWPTLVGMKSLIDFGINNVTGDLFSCGLVLQAQSRPH